MGIYRAVAAIGRLGPLAEGAGKFADFRQI